MKPSTLEDVRAGIEEHFAERVAELRLEMQAAAVPEWAIEQAVEIAWAQQRAQWEHDAPRIAAGLQSDLWH